MSELSKNPLYCSGCFELGDICSNHPYRSLTEHTASIMSKSFVHSDGSLLSRIAHSGAVSLRMTDYTGFTDEGLHMMHFRGALAFLHDIGYAYPDSGMHSLDGARWIRSVHPELDYFAPYVAWHSNAKYEYLARGFELATIAEEFPIPTGSQEDVELALLWVADFTSSPTGDRVGLDERIANIESRYDEDSPVIHALNNSLPDLEAAVNLVEETFSLKIAR